MTKRDYVQEITEKRSRLKKKTRRWNQVLNRIINLIEITEYLRNKKTNKMPARSEVVKYLPIAYAACIEGYFKLVYRDLIDHGKPYRDNVSKIKDLTINIDHVIAMQDGQVTFGEYVSHILPSNSLEKINETMTALIGISFLDHVKTFKHEYLKGQPLTTLNEINMSERVIRDIKAVFAQRHIFAHELNSKHPVNINQLLRISTASLYLLDVTEAITENLLSSGT